MIRLGVLGAGAWGFNLVRAVAECPQTELTAVCDADPAARERVRRRFRQARVLDGPDDLLEDPDLDAILVATPPRLHYEHARRALEAGRHVWVEKPFCTNSQDAAELCRLADERHLVLMVGHTVLYNSLLHDVKRRLDAAELGRVQYVHMRRLNLGRVRADVDVLWNLAPHDLAMACYLMDAWPTRVNARGWGFLQPQRGLADVCFFQMEFDGGAAASGHVSWVDPRKDRTVVVVGSEKMLVYDDLDPTRHLQVYDKRVELEFHSPLDNFSDYAARVRSGDLSIPHVTPNEPLAAQMSHFAQCVQSGQPPLTDGRQGLRIVCLLEAMTRSMRGLGRIEDVHYLSAPRPAAPPANAGRRVEETSWNKSLSTI